MILRGHNPDRDHLAVRRIFAEVGWTDLSDTPRLDALDARIATGRALVAEIDGQAECIAHCAPGTIQYLGKSLPYSGVTSVAASVVARKQGFAGRLTAQAVAEEAEAGALVSGLGIFEQGYYDRLGFGTGAYDHYVWFDPQRLLCPVPSRPPKRLTREDWSVMHASRLQRTRQHGWVTLSDPEITRSDAYSNAHSFGLGFYDGTELTHHVWFQPQQVDHGPYWVGWMAYRTPPQFMELMGLIRALGDQVRSMRLVEHAEFQLQDLIDHPLHEPHLRRGSPYQAGIETDCEWQVRMNDLPACLAQTHLDCPEIRFNLILADPIQRFLEDRPGWKGVAGEYTLTLGPNSDTQPGHASGLPELNATVNSFTRMWLGVRPATGLAMTDTLQGPPDLLASLDRAFRLPTPKRDWRF